MSKATEALALVQTQEDSTQRALLVAGILTTLMRIRGVDLVVVGDLAFDCYINAENTTPEITLCVLEGQLTPRLIQEVMVGELEATGRVWNWDVIGFRVRFGGKVITEYPGLCREFQTHLGIARLVPAEELVAERILAAVYPVTNQEARVGARRVLALAMAGEFEMDWEVLAHLCASPKYDVGSALESLRGEARKEAEKLVAEAEANAQAEEGVQSMPAAHYDTGDAYAPADGAAQVTGVHTAPAQDVPPTKRETTRLPSPVQPPAA